MKQSALFTAIFSLLATLAWSQSPEEVRRFADRQYRAGNLDLALKEYQRVIYFDKERAFPELYERIAAIYYTSGEYEEAIRHYDLASRAIRDDSTRLEMFFRKTLCYFHQEEYLLALGELYSLPDTLSPYFTYNRDLYLAICQFGLDALDESKAYLGNILDPAGMQQVDTLFGEYLSYKEKYDPDRLEMMSILLPGLGQLYGGEPWPALNSLGLLTAVTAYSFYTASTYTLFDGLLVFASWFYRYYTGGHKKAYEIGERLQAEKQHEVYRRLLEISVPGTVLTE